MVFQVQELFPIHDLRFTNKKTAPPEKDGTVYTSRLKLQPRRLFLPSTVLTVSGSRGLHRLLISDLHCRLKSIVLKSAFGNRHSAMAGLSAPILQIGAPPKASELSNSRSDSKSLCERVQRCGSHVTIGYHNKFNSRNFGGR